MPFHYGASQEMDRSILALGFCQSSRMMTRMMICVGIRHMPLGLVVAVVFSGMLMVLVVAVGFCWVPWEENFVLNQAVIGVIHDGPGMLDIF